MTPTDEDREAVFAHVRRVKEDECANPEPAYDGDIPTMITLIRDGRTCGVVLGPPDRDRMLAALAMGVSGFDADAAWLAFETINSERRCGPSGRRWRSGEMQQVLETRADAYDWVSEAITVIYADRDDDVFVYHVGFQRQREHGTVTWLPQEQFEGAMAGGDVVRYIRYVFATKSIGSLLEEAGATGLHFGLTDHEARLHQDLAASEALLEGTGCAVALPLHSEEDRAMAEASRQMWEERGDAPPPPDVLALADQVEAYLRDTQKPWVGCDNCGAADPTVVTDEGRFCSDDCARAYSF